MACLSVAFSNDFLDHAKLPLPQEAGILFKLLIVCHQIKGISNPQMPNEQRKIWWQTVLGQMLDLTMMWPLQQG